jgi:hypothetical protein
MEHHDGYVSVGMGTTRRNRHIDHSDDRTLCGVDHIISFGIVFLFINRFINRFINLFRSGMDVPHIVSVHRVASPVQERQTLATTIRCHMGGRVSV